ncbi:Autophagy- protein 8C-like, variant 2 [Lathyrus oleraceus]|uniref:Autophagy- protein 8C-like, variant 2 n=1 Tax=Pisum sativum TaxID=3888 RepID=A0A9D5BNU0_PEA|nr:Autophagy- protein 8C-like, variant 2 [Pisum sativum]
MIASWQHDRVEATATTTRARRGDVEDLHLHVGKAAMTGSHRKRLANQFSALMSALYEEHKDEDGFLYMTYSGENTFGSQ